MTPSTDHTLPRRIRPTVSPKAVEVVSRFFNATLTDILLELFQNSRRAGATRVDVETREGSRPDRILVIVADDGSGIEEPKTVLTFGESHWSAQILQNDDPAGMGLYALAGREFTIQTTTENGIAWFMKLTPENFDDRKAATAEAAAPFEKPGTVITFETEECKEWWIESCLAMTARFQRVRVYLNKKLLEQKDINAGAFYTERWGPRNAVTFGVHVRDESIVDSTNAKLEINGHPVLHERLASVMAMRPEDLGPMAFYVTARAGDLPELRLVLPTRKEAVADDFLTKSMRPAALAAIYRGLAANHRKLGVAFSDDNRRTALEHYAIELPEPRPRLLPWGVEDWRRATVDKVLPNLKNLEEFKRTEPDAVIAYTEVMGEKMVCNTIALLERRHEKGNRLFKPDPRLQSTAWYRQMPVVTLATASLIYDDKPEYMWNLADYPPDNIREQARGPKPARIVIRLHSTQPDRICNPIEYETTWLAVSPLPAGDRRADPRPPDDNTRTYRQVATAAAPEAAILILSKNHEADPELVVTLASAMAEDPNDTLEVDDLARQWRGTEIRQLLGTSEATRQLLVAEAELHLAGLVPNGAKATVTIDETGAVNVDLASQSA